MRVEITGVAWILRPPPNEAKEVSKFLFERPRIHRDLVTADFLAVPKSGEAIL
jgi:hypothetical protein